MKLPRKIKKARTILSGHRNRLRQVLPTIGILTVPEMSAEEANRIAQKITALQNQRGPWILASESVRPTITLYKRMRVVTRLK